MVALAHSQPLDRACEEVEQWDAGLQFCEIGQDLPSTPRVGGGVEVERVCEQLSELIVPIASQEVPGKFTENTEIGDRLGLSDGRVRQIVRLSKMHSRIIDFLSSLHGEENLKRFSEHRLRSAISVPKDQQLERFQKAFGLEISS